METDSGHNRNAHHPDIKSLERPAIALYAAQLTVGDNNGRYSGVLSYKLDYGKTGKHSLMPISSEIRFIHTVILKTANGTGATVKG